MPPKATAAAAVAVDEMEEEVEDVVAPKELDDKSLKAFFSFFKTLSDEPHIIRFFDRKGFYSVHGATAALIARQFYRTTAVVRGADTPGGLPYVNVNRSMFETILRELLLGGTAHVVELYEQAGTGWKLARSATPGRLSAFDEELYRNSGGGGGGGELADVVPVVAALSFSAAEGQVTAGLAYVDPSAGRLGACELLLLGGGAGSSGGGGGGGGSSSGGGAAGDQLGGLEAALVQLGAREVLVNKDSLALLDAGVRSRLDALLGEGGGLGVMATERPAAPLFGTKHLEADLAKVIKGGAVEQHADVLERRTACTALAGLLAYTELMAEAADGGGSSSGGGGSGGSGGGGGGRYSLSLYNAGQYMRLDATAQRALNVLPSRQDANATFSLYGLLNRCRSAMGKRRLKSWLKQPLVDLPAIAARHDAVEALVGDTELRQRLRDQHFRGLPDVERLARKLAARRTSLAELHALYRASAKLPLIEEALRCHEGPHAAALVERAHVAYAEPLAAAHDGERLQRFEELLEAALDADRLPDEYCIAPGYDARLGALAERRQEVTDEIEELAEAAARDLGLELGKSVKLEWHKAANTRSRCLRITQKEEKNVRGKLQSKYLVIETRKDGTKFTNKALREAAERLNAAAGQYAGVQAELVEQVVSVAATFVEVWEEVGALLAEMDVLLGFAEAACVAPTPYVRPEMLGPDEGVIELLQCRHPCVEVQEGVAFVPNDCVLRRGGPAAEGGGGGGGGGGGSWFQIITGPNMGGKSTYIRQVGVCVLLAQVGCFVPCASARIAVRDSVFCRVGAGDCQARGVSTFMAEMLETAAILRGATSHSLVIIDELGRGTSTYDGFGLAWAISEHLAGPACGAPCLFATHFHELTELTADVGVQNMQAAAVIDPATHKLTMLYSIRPGACDQSFGVHVAESAGFPPQVIAAANERLKALEAAQARVRVSGPAAKRRRTAEGAVVDAVAAGVAAEPAANKGQEGAAVAAAAQEEEDVEELKAFLRRFAQLPLAGRPAGEAAAAVRALLAELPPHLRRQAEAEAGAGLGGSAPVAAC
ncbi:hypothetical protein HYH02_014280 [Chlamydomonas schloesseri]|uniref:DNA mismatch repair proteins mutS family domain-containing protein n=1 Tax=Chlamydomonas schloesseri TaxID=2026947 RepID=A0A835SV84_9CHLO|nr:hypothetical protein HYH02_014280 [Chlamydomonas schloesseri]|eukprot:KAG2428869.1 hypothetical protein HYH02_014280 [Chlamydomonas schloesseri]